MKKGTNLRRIEWRFALGHGSWATLGRELQQLSKIKVKNKAANYCSTLSKSKSRLGSKYEVNTVNEMRQGAVGAYVFARVVGFGLGGSELLSSGEQTAARCETTQSAKGQMQF